MEDCYLALGIVVAVEFAFNTWVGV